MGAPCKQCSHHASASQTQPLKFIEDETAPCQLFEHSGTATIIVGQTMAIARANARTEEMFGYSKAELFDSPCFIDYLTPEYRELVKIHHELALAGQVAPPKSLECKIYHKDGSIKEVLAEIGWLTQSRETVITLIDWTHRKAAERERHSLSEIVEQSSESILLTDVHGCIVYVNAAFEALSGYSRE